MMMDGTKMIWNTIGVPGSLSQPTNQKMMATTTRKVPSVTWVDGILRTPENWRNRYALVNTSSAPTRNHVSARTSSGLSAYTTASVGAKRIMLTAATNRMTLANRNVFAAR